MRTVLRFETDHAGPARRWAWLETKWASAAIVLSVLNALGWAYGFLIHRRQVDFEVYIMGGHHFASNALYTAVQVPWPHLPFTYPPFSALLFAPLAQLPYHVAQVVWASVNLALLVGLLSVTLVTLRPSAVSSDREHWRLVALLLGPVVLLEPVMLDLSFGQINALIVLMVVADMTGAVRIGGRALPRGLLLGIAAGIKLIPLVFLPFLVVTRQWRKALVASLTFVVCSLVPFLYNHQTSWRYWTFYISDVKRIGAAAYVSNQSLRGALDRFQHHLMNGAGLTLASGVFVALGLWAAWRWWQRGASFLAMLLMAAAGMIASPITWCHHMIYIVPLLAWLWWGTEPLRHRRVWAAVVTALFLWAPMWRIPNDGPVGFHEHGWELIAGSAFFLATVFFVVLFAVLALSSARRRPVTA